MKDFLFGRELRVFSFVFIIMLFIAFINGTPFLFGDSYGYYHVAKTVVTQATYPTPIQPEYYEYSGHGVNILGSNYITPYSSGQSILLFPFIAISSLFSNGTTFNDYYKAFNGHSLYDGIAVLNAAVIYGFLGIIFTYLFLKELGFSKKLSFFSPIAIFISLHLISYTFEQPGYSHVYEFFAYSAFLYFFTKFFIAKHAKYLYFASIFAGILVLIRIVDVALILLPFLFILYKIRSKKVVFTSYLILVFFASILLAYNYLSYGNPFTLGYTINGNSGFSTNLNIIPLLFSNTRGLFMWSPLILLSVLGLVLYSKKSKSSLVFFIFPVGLLLFIYNFWSNWWGGVSAGQRFLIVLAPLFALGFAYLYTRFRFKFVIKLVGVVLILFSLSLSILYRLTPVLKLNSIYRNDLSSFTTPTAEDYRVTDIFKYHYDLYNSSESFLVYLSSLKEGFNGGRSLILLWLGQTDPLIRIENLSPLRFKVHFIPNNIKADTKVNTFITLKYLNKTQTYLIPNKSYKEYSTATISCNAGLVCNSNEIEMIQSNENNSDVKYSAIQYNLEAAVYGENKKINFVNLKLK